MSLVLVDVADGVATLTLNNPTTAFSGTYRSLAGRTNLGFDNLFGNPAVVGQAVAAVDLQGTSVLNILGGTDQAFRNLTGSADSTIVFGAANSVVSLQVDPAGNYSFLGRDGRIPWTIMPDQLHPTAAGYQLWAEAIAAPLAEMMR